VSQESLKIGTGHISDRKQLINWKGKHFSVNCYCFPSLTGRRHQVNFTNILGTALLPPIFIRQKMQTQAVSREKL